MSRNNRFEALVLKGNLLDDSIVHQQLEGLDYFIVRTFPDLEFIFRNKYSADLYLVSEITYIPQDGGKIDPFSYACDYLFKQDSFARNVTFAIGDYTSKEAERYCKEKTIQRVKLDEIKEFIDSSFRIIK